jgi:hypothetical protein
MSRAFTSVTSTNARLKCQMTALYSIEGMTSLRSH